MTTWGILLLLSATGAAAQKLYTEPSGIIYSPNYPNNYSDNINVSFAIMAEPGNYIHLTFLQFETEETYDELVVFGQNNETELRISGRKTGQSVNIQSPEALLVFTTDLTNNFQGFAIQYTSLKIGTFYTPPDICPGTLHDSPFGIITSPNWPELYPNNFTCTYFIVAEPKHRIRLQFLAFSTEAAYDVVEIYDGFNSEFPLLGEFSGNKSFPAVESSENSMFIVFSTDLVNNFSGFSALYVAIPMHKSTTPEVIHLENILH